MHVSTFIWKHFIIGQVTWLERQIMSKSDNLMLSLNHSDPESMGESFTCAIGFSTSPLMWSTVSYAKVLFMQLHYISQQKKLLHLVPSAQWKPCQPSLSVSCCFRLTQSVSIPIHLFNVCQRALVWSYHPGHLWKWIQSWFTRQFCKYSWGGGGDFFYMGYTNKSYAMNLLMHNSLTIFIWFVTEMNLARRWYP